MGGGGSDFPLPRPGLGICAKYTNLRTFKDFCVSVQLALLEQLVVYVLWGYVALTTYFETSEAYFAV